MGGFQRAVTVVLGIVCATLAGCGGLVTIPYTPPTPPVTAPATTGSGNWFFFGYRSVKYSAVIASYYFGGSLINSGGQISGVFHIQDSCFGNGSTDVPYTGTLDSKNNLNITSSAVAGQTLSLKGMLSEDAQSIKPVSFTVIGGCSGIITSTTAGSGPGLQQSYASLVPNLTGTWTGNASSTTSSQGFSITEQLTQSSSPDAHGDFALSGTVTVQGSPCFTKGTLQSLSFVSSVEGQEHFLMDDGSTIDAVVNGLSGRTPQSKLVYDLFPVTISGGRCDGNYDVNQVVYNQ